MTQLPNMYFTEAQLIEAVQELKDAWTALNSNMADFEARLRVAQATGRLRGMVL